MSRLALFGIGCGIFLIATVYDLVYSRYLEAFASRKSIAAGNWSCATYAVGIIGTASVINLSGWMVIPEMAGLWLGSVIGVELVKIRSRD